MAAPTATVVIACATYPSAHDAFAREPVAERGGDGRQHARAGSSSRIDTKPTAPVPPASNA